MATLTPGRLTTVAKVNKLEDRSRKIMKKQADGLDALATKLTGSTNDKTASSRDLDKLIKQLSEDFTDLTKASDIPFNGQIAPPKITRITRNND